MVVLNLCHVIVSLSVHGRIMLLFQSLYMEVLKLCHVIVSFSVHGSIKIVSCYSFVFCTWKYYSPDIVIVVKTNQQ